MSDKTGQRFGFLKVQKKLTEKDKGGGYLCLCLCTGCGEAVKVPSRHLCKGGNTSCGCQRFRKGRGMKDMTGQRFGMLRVLKMVDVGKPTMYWVCQCDCGNTCTVDGATLRRERHPKTNCGCISLRGIRTNNAPIVTGQQYGMLTAVRQVRVKKTNTPTKDGTAPAWVCLCECGNETTLESHSLRNGTTQSCGCLTAIKASERAGKGHPSYNPALTDDQRNPRQFSREYLRWRKRVAERDKVCQRCGDTQKLHIHHIYTYNFHPELRTEDSNGIVLCNDCHRGYHHKYGNLKCNANQISNWIGRRVRVNRKKERVTNETD